MRRSGLATLAIAMIALPVHAADSACGAALNPATRQLVDHERYAIAFAPRGPRITVGRHFALDMVVCPRGQTPLPTAVSVDADMPVHQHGMNYRASVQPLGAGRYRADGLMFHMPGRWRMIFDVSAAGQSTRLTREFDVE